jgi:hypothetical protein
MREACVTAHGRSGLGESCWAIGFGIRRYARARGNYIGMVRVYCAHGFNSAHGVAWCVTRHFTFIEALPRRDARRPALSDSVHGVQKLRERNENLQNFSRVNLARRRPPWVRRKPRWTAKCRFYVRVNYRRRNATLTSP